MFEAMKASGHEELIFCQDKEARLRTLIAIHDTTLGPAVGGTRMRPYETEDGMITDALRLSEGMTYKSAAAGANCGGGKAVIWGDPADKDELLLRAFGRFVDTLGGRFITGTDMGTVPYDFVVAGAETEYLVALPEEFGGSGDTSIITAFGIYKGIKACCRRAFQSDSLDGRTIAVQGLGKVGYRLIKHLVEEGAVIFGTDTRPEALQHAVNELGITAVEPETIYDLDCDVFSPNALGAVLDSGTIPRLRCRVVAGGANNQLATEADGDRLHERGILYAPDYVINAGGLIHVADELEGFDRERAFERAARIYDRLERIFQIAEERGMPTHRAADVMARERIQNLGGLNRIYLP